MALAGLTMIGANFHERRLLSKVVDAPPIPEPQAPDPRKEAWERWPWTISVPEDLDIHAKRMMAAGRDAAAAKLDFDKHATHLRIAGWLIPAIIPENFGPED